MWDWPNLVPIVIFAIMYLTSKVWGKWYCQVVEHTKVVDFITGFMPGRMTNLFPTKTLTMSLVLAFHCLPQTMRPVEACVLYVLWNMYFRIIFYSIFFHLKDILLILNITFIILLQCQILRAIATNHTNHSNICSELTEL